MELTVESVAKYVFKSDKPIEPLIEQLRAEPDKADSILEAFASSRGPDRRSWAAWAAPQVLPRERAVSLLTELTTSRSADVSTEALFRLMELDRSAAITLLPRIRRKLHSNDISEPVAAMWILAELDADASQEILDAAEQSNYPFHRLVAEAVTLYMKRDTKEIARLIKARGENALYLVAAAEKLNDPSLRDLVRKWHTTEGTPLPIDSD